MDKLKKIFASRVALSLFALLAVSACTLGIGAVFTAADKAINTFSVGTNIIEIVEDFDPPEELEPGISFTKNVTVKNTGSVDCFVRVMAEFSDSDMGKYCTVDWNTADWVLNEQDGYWYYKYAIQSGMSTKSLFTEVTLSDDIDPAAVKDFDIIVYAESYQSHGFSNYADAWAHYQTNKP